MAIVQLQVQRWHGSQCSVSTDDVVIEAPLQLLARGKVVLTVMRTPGADEELLRGLLHAEAIANCDDATLVCDLGEHGDGVAHIDIDPTLFADRGTVSSAACGVCGRAGIADLQQRAVAVAARTTFARSVLLSLPAKLRAKQEVFNQTGGLHAAGLFDAAGQLLAIREDVGRHNAVDKLVGWARSPAQRDQIDPGHTVVMVSGRLGYELVQKTVRFGAPVIASISAPSSLAIAVAEQFSVTAVGFVRDDNCNVYSHPWRLA
jgi:FdhD protein